MAKGIGRLLQFGIAKETTRGTANAAADFWVPFTDGLLEEKFENVTDDQSRGIIEDSAGQSRVMNWAEGPVTFPIEDKSFPLVLYSALGAVSSATNSDVSGSVRDHTITVAQSAQHQALTFFIDDPVGAQDYKHANGMIDSLDINYEQKKFIEASINVKAKTGATATLTPSQSTQNRFLPHHLTFKVATSYGILSTGSTIVLKSLKLSIKSNLESDEVLGSSAPADFLNKEFAIEGELEALWQNESDFKSFTLAGTQKAMRIDLINTDVTIGAAANPRLRFDFAKVIFTEITRPVVLKDLVKQTLKFKAHYSTTDSLMVSILATSLQGSY